MASALCLGALTVASIGQRANRRWLVFGGLGPFRRCAFAGAGEELLFGAAFLGIAGWGMLLFFSTVNTLAANRRLSDAMRGRVMGIWALFSEADPAGGIGSGGRSRNFFGYSSARLLLGRQSCAVAGLVVLLMVQTDGGGSKESRSLSELIG